MDKEHVAPISNISYFKGMKGESQCQELKETRAKEKENEDEDPAKIGDCRCIIFRLLTLLHNRITWGSLKNTYSQFLTQEILTVLGRNIFENSLGDSNEHHNSESPALILWFCAFAAAVSIIQV